MRTIILSSCLILALSCVTATPPSAPIHAPIDDESITAAGVSRDRATLWYATNGDRCEVHALTIADGTQRVAFDLDWCPTRISMVDEASFVLTDGLRHGAWKRSDGTDVVAGTEILAAASATNFVTVRGDRLFWSRDGNERELGPTGASRSPVFVPGSGDLLMIARGEAAEHVVRVTQTGSSDVSPLFDLIDSFDVSPHGDEIVFSARRDGGFDVAIASLDGKTVNWIPPDPSDEVGVTWAPRGNKVSYLIRRLDATLVRTVHVVSAFQLMFDTSSEKVSQLAWDPRAERIVMIAAGPVTSPHIDWIEYAGEKRVTLVQPRTKLPREPERVGVGEGGALLIPPRAVRYGKKLPLLVTLIDDPLAWDASILDLDTIDAGVLRLSAVAWGDGKAILPLLDELKWVDSKSIVVIAGPSASKSGLPVVTKEQTLLIGGTKQTGSGLFDEHRLPNGASMVEYRDWIGAMTYLRNRFPSKR